MKLRASLVILAVILVMSTVNVLAADNEETYKLGVEEMSRYLQKDDQARLEVCINAFESLGTYRCSDMLLRYCKVLSALEKGEYTSSVIKTSLLMLKASRDFASLVAGKDWRNSPIRSSVILEYYVNARIAQDSGDLKAAQNAYIACDGFFDASERAKAMTDSMYLKALDYIENEMWTDAKEILETLPEGQYPNAKSFIQLCSDHAPKQTVTTGKTPDVATEPLSEDNWGPWSEWSMTGVAASADRQIETKTENQLVKVYYYATYRYPRTARYNPVKKTYTMSNWAYASQKTKTYVIGKDKEEYLGNWEKTETIGARVGKDSEGHYTINGMIWYPNGSAEEYRDVTLYRYRTKN